MATDGDTAFGTPSSNRRALERVPLIWTRSPADFIRARSRSAASIEDQVRLCAERAERDGWTVMQTFTDMAISGASLHRAGLQSLLDHAAQGGIDLVLCEALDRLSRDQADVATLYKQLAFHGTGIATLSEGDNTSFMSA